MVETKKSKLRSREERGGNIVSIEAYDNTSNAYRRKREKRPEASFGFYLSIAILVFISIFFFALYDLAVETWTRIK